MGRFADAHIAGFDATPNSTSIEHLLDVPRPDLLRLGDRRASPVPAEHDTRDVPPRAATFICGPEADADECRTSSPRPICCARPAADAGAGRRRRRGPGARRSRARGRGAARRRRRPALAVICRDGPRMAAAGARAVVLRARASRCCEFPAWDCLPYDRVSPHAGIVAQRMTTLSRLAASRAATSRRCCSPRSTPRCSACRRAI